MTTRLTVSISDDDVRILDRYVAQRGLGGRSAGVRAAVRMLATAGLERDYAEAFGQVVVEVDSPLADDADVWDVTAGDGIDW